MGGFCSGLGPWVQWGQGVEPRARQGRSRLTLPWFMAEGHWQGAAQGSMPLAPVTFCLQELFKAFARHLSHSLTQKASPGRSGECPPHQARGCSRGLVVGRLLALISAFLNL